MSANPHRSRAPNFNKEEQLLLFSVMKPFTKLIACKKTDSVKQIDKQRAWSKVAEIYNAKTKGVQRTTENLISCYRNTKNKFKKQMLLEDISKTEAFFNVLEEHDKDWSATSSSTDIPADVCQSSFTDLQNIAKKDDALDRKQILGTGDMSPSITKKSVKDSFYALSQEKMELVKIQRTILEMEMNHKSRLYALELEDKEAENKFKAELRQNELKYKAELHQKELEILQLKINKETQ